MASIGDLILQLLVDGSQLTPAVQKEAAKAGDAGAQTLGAKLSGGLKTTGIKAFGAVASAAFGIATAGALKLEEIQARITAETGASADEAKATAKVINQVAGDERLSLESVADIAIKVRRDLGATGPVADQLTAKIARFARVTRQDGGAAVSDIDNLVDAWGLSLNDVGGLLDKLIVSGQKWGGSITEDEKALAEIAPQLKAFNLSIDDGIALLDLFKASGVDASQVPKALTSALQKLNGRPLKDFIVELAGIEDPAARARRAIEVFGTKAGVQLANAIKPGMKSLDDLGITAAESQGALDKAADALDSTFGARFQRMLSQAGAKLRDFGSDFGPLFTGIASLASLGGAIGLDDFVKKFAGKLAEAGKAGGEALIDAVGTATGAAGTVIGNLIAQALDPHNPFLNGVIGKTAAAAGRLWGTIFGAAVDLADAAAAAIGRIPGAGKVSAAIDRTASFLGTGFGKAFGIAAAAGAIFWFLDEWNKQRAGLAVQGEQIGADIAASIARGNLAELKRQREAVAQALLKLTVDPATVGQFDPLKPFRTLLAGDEIDRLGKELGQLDTKIAALQATTQQPVINPKAFLGPPVPAELLRKQGEQAVAEILNGASGAIRHGGTGVVDAMARLRSLTLAQIVQLTPEARQAMAQVSLALASGIRDKRSAIDAAIAQLKTDIKNGLKPGREIGHDIGLLLGRAIRRGLKSADPEVRAQAEGTRALIEARLIELVKSGGKAGQQVLDKLADAMRSKDPAVRNQAARTKGIIDAALKAEGGAKSPGDKIGEDLATDLASKGPIVGRVAYAIGVDIARNLRAGLKGTGYVPPSLPSTGGTPTVGSGGKQSGNVNYQHGTPYVPTDQFAFLHRGEAVLTASENAARQSWSGGVTIENLSVDARGQANPAATGAAVRQGVADAMADVLRSQDARLPVGVRS